METTISPNPSTQNKDDPSQRTNIHPYRRLMKNFSQIQSLIAPTRCGICYHLLSIMSTKIMRLIKRTKMNIATTHKNISWTLRTAYMRIRISLFRINKLTYCTTQVHQSRCYLLTSTSHESIYVTACTPQRMPKGNCREVAIPR